MKTFKMKTGLIFAVVIATVSAATYFDYDAMPYSGESLELDDDRASGLCYEVNKVICTKDCKHLYLCVKDEGVWSPILIETCAGNTFCNGNEGKCTSHLSTCSPTDPPIYQLSCTATGLFPDPYDCTVYHNCPLKGNASQVMSCPSGWSYNALTTECDHSVEDGVCFPEGLIPVCQTPGQSGPVPENTNIYYICVQSSSGLVPELFKCAHGGHYSEGQCTSTPPPPPTTPTAGTEEPPPPNQS